MSEHDPNLAEQLRTVPVPHFDSTALIAGATTAGRRSVRNRRVGAAVASAAVVALVAAGTSAQMSASSAPEPQVATTTTAEPTPDVEVDRAAVPYGGSWFSFIADDVTQRTVGRIGSPDPVPTDAPSPTPGAEDEVEQFFARDAPRATFALDGITTNVSITWGTQEMTPEEADFYNRTVPRDSDEEEFVAEGYGTRTMAHCRAVHEEGTDYRRGTCRRGPDGTAWLAYGVRLGPDEENPRTWEVRGAVVYQPDEWVLSVEQRSGGGFDEPPYLEKMASPTELYRLLRDGEWFR